VENFPFVKIIKAEKIIIISPTSIIIGRVTYAIERSNQQSITKIRGSPRY